MKLLAILSSFMALAAANPLSSPALSPVSASIVSTPSSTPTPSSNSTFRILSSSSYNIDCGPGNGVWIPGSTYRSLVYEFCLSAEGTDISDGYSQSDTYLATLSPQGKQTTGSAGKVICAVPFLT